MKREDLEKLGLTEEQITDALDLHHEEMTQIKNRFARWFAIYFPEYTDVFGDYEAQSSMLLLKKVCTPEAIVELEAEKSNQIWRDAKLRAVGMKRATTLCETARRSIGLRKGSSAARYEMKLLLADYEYKKAQLDSIMEEITAQESIKDRRP